MRTVYVVLTKSDTYLSRFIHFITKARYTHASLSFDEKLQPLYSFSRFQPFPPLPAGLHHESFEVGFFKKYSYIPCAVYKIDVDDYTFEKAKNEVDAMLQNAEYYRFSILGLVLCGCRIPLKRKRYYFCSQFVSYILETANIVELPYSPTLMRPSDYTKIEKLECIFEGKLNELKEQLNTYETITQ